ncbi:MAG: aldo/keto reductase [Kiritimatiellae bacterium]|jgi:aryl-alcohol dehydrogenase-like predicted oxidoreductase|nr:aldo/keto reductase [Kiritimatiellia bacterium]
MKQRILGKTGLSVTPICVGGWQLAGPLAFDGQPDGHPDPGKDNVLRLIQELGERGINFIDTAEQYGGGESERRVGQALQSHRDDWIISTKFGYRVGPGGGRNDSSSPETIIPSIEGSLKRLNTDYIDIYLYHCAPAISELEKGRAILEKLVEQGKCRYYGISTGNVELVRAMIQLDMMDVLQYPSNLLNDAEEMRSVALAHNIGTQVRGIMAQGKLSGRYFKNQPEWSSDDNRSRPDNADNYKRYSAFNAILPEGCTMAQATIRWTLNQPGNHSICMGAKNLNDYIAAIEAAKMPALTTGEQATMEECAATIKS